MAKGGLWNQETPPRSTSVSSLEYLCLGDEIPEQVHSYIGGGGEVELAMKSNENRGRTRSLFKGI